jgi:hypothetical protein
VARAKRTDRADARRRYRADQAAQTAAEEEAAAAAEAYLPPREGTTAANSTATTSTYGRKSKSPTASKTSTAPPERVPFLTALRTSYQIADVRGDLRALPGLIPGRSFLVPAGLSLASTVMAIAIPPNSITAIVVTLFLGPLPIGSIYAAGVLAPRASWLMGAIASFIGTLGLVVYALWAINVSGETGTAPAVTDVAYALTFYTLFGGVIGAGLGYYRRLLKAMNPQGPRGGSKPKPRSKAGARAN